MIIVRELRELKRRLDGREVDTTVISKTRVVYQGEGLCRTNLHVRDHVDIINLKPGQKDSGKNQGTTSIVLMFVRTIRGKIIRRSVTNIRATKTS